MCHFNLLPFVICYFPFPLDLFVLICCFPCLSLIRVNAENMHYFSSLALTLNEQEEGIAPTDSRLRPDQRMMEAGLWDEANIHKQRLEERQRLERKKREVQANQALEEGEHKLIKKNKDNDSRSKFDPLRSISTTFKKRGLVGSFKYTVL